MLLQLNDLCISERLFEIYDELQTLNKELASVTREIEENQARFETQTTILTELDKEHDFNYFDRAVFNVVVDKAVVHANRNIEFFFYGNETYLFKFDEELYEQTKNCAKYYK